MSLELSIAAGETEFRLFFKALGVEWMVDVLKIVLETNTKEDGDGLVVQWLSTGLESPIGRSVSLAVCAEFQWQGSNEHVCPIVALEIHL